MTDDVPHSTSNQRFTITVGFDEGGVDGSMILDVIAAIDGVTVERIPSGLSAP
jgi:hypothetical protein